MSVCVVCRTNWYILK